MHRRALALIPLLASAPALAQEQTRAGVSEIASIKNATAAYLEPLFEQYAPWLLIDVVGSELWRFLAVGATVLIFMGLRRLVVWLTLGFLRGLTKRTDTDIDDQVIEAVNPPLGWLVMWTGLYLGLFWPNLPPSIDSGLDVLYRIGALAIVGWAMLRCVHILTGVLARLAAHTESDLDDYLVPLVGRILRIAVLALIVVFGMQELGFNVAGLLAGLGVGGLAFALAAQQTVANWFGALMIYTDQPFKIGDWIKTPELEGVVEDIGLRSTRVRTFSKTLVSIPNSTLAVGTIENVSRMPIRRVSFKLGITYATTPAMMRATLERLRALLRDHPGVDQAFHLVRFDEFASSSLNIMVYYFTSTTDWDAHLAVREDVNLQIMDIMADVGVQAAFPSQSIYMEQVDDEEIRRLDARAREALTAAKTREAAPADA